MPEGDEPTDAVVAELAALRRRVPGVRCSVIGGADGLLRLYESGGGFEPHDLAALAAAAVGVGRQTGLVLRHGGFRLTTIQSEDGYFAVYLVDEANLLAVVGDDGMNVARLHLEARAITDRLAELLVAAERHWSAGRF